MLNVALVFMWRSSSEVVINRVDRHPGRHITNRYDTGRISKLSGDVRPCLKLYLPTPKPCDGTKRDRRPMHESDTFAIVLIMVLLAAP